MQRNHAGTKNPNFGRKGKNQYSKLDWSVVPWELLGRQRRRSILMREANWACSVCGFKQLREDGVSILQIDHIDGNHSNNAKENQRVVCPNCHALTSKKHLFIGRHHTDETKEKLRNALKCNRK